MFIKGVFAGTLSGSLNALIAEASGYTTRTTGVHMDGMMYRLKIIRMALSLWTVAVPTKPPSFNSQPTTSIT